MQNADMIEFACVVITYISGCCIEIVIVFLCEGINDLEIGLHNVLGQEADLSWYWYWNWLIAGNWKKSLDFRFFRKISVILTCIRICFKLANLQKTTRHLY